MNKILGLSSLTFLILIACSYVEDSDIKVSIRQSDKNEVVLVFKNMSKRKYILPNILLFGDILTFYKAPEVNFNGVVVDREYPHHFDKESINFNEFVENECYLNDTINYRVILPGDSFSMKYDIYDSYEGIEENKTYTIQYRINIDKEYSDYCPLIWNGIIESNTILFNP